MLTIFSFVEYGKEQIPNDIVSCPKFSSRVWLWPFSQSIREMSLKSDRLCEEQRQHAKSIASLKAHKKKVGQIKIMETVVGDLEKSEYLLTISTDANR